MADDEVLARAERLVRLQGLLINNPRGLTTLELVNRTGVSRRTVQRDIRSLERMHLPLEVEGGRYRMLTTGMMPPLRLVMEEATALFIAARLLCRYSDEQNPWIAQALDRLAAVLPEQVGKHVRACADASRGAEADHGRYRDVFAGVTRAWAEQRIIRMHYRSSTAERSQIYLVRPYFIEPSAVGFAAYVIGMTDRDERLRTFKIERIEHVEILDERFEPAPDFDAIAWLRQSWGVMAGGQIEVVILRFSPAVARRVHESVWHPNQRLEDEPTGSVRFLVAISEPREMLPWIRGWGPEVEVLEPAWLRKHVSDDMRHAAEIYQ